MADDNTVQITFSASTDDALSGIAQVGDGLNALRALLGGLSGELGRLGGTLRTALQPDLIGQSANAFADMGTAAQGAAAKAGDAAKAQIEQFQSAIKLADAQYDSTKSFLASELKLHEITYSEESRQLLEALADRHTAETVALNDELQIGNISVERADKINEQKKRSDQKYAVDRQKIMQQAAEEEAKQWKAAADQIASAFNSQLKGLLAGTTTWSKAMKSISADLILKMIEDQVKLTVEWLANQARILATHIAAETGMTAATTTGAALRAGAEVVSGQASILDVIARALKAIFAGGAETAAGVSANVAPEAGPAAPAIGAAAGAAVVAEATGMLYDVGTNYVVRGGLAVIHPGETIIPAGMQRAVGSGPYTGGSGGGGRGSGSGGDVHLNISALDSRSIARFFSDNAHHMAKALKLGARRGVHLNTARA